MLQEVLWTPSGYLTLDTSTPGKAVVHEVSLGFMSYWVHSCDVGFLHLAFTDLV